jgi:hypothetical protein
VAYAFALPVQRSSGQAPLPPSCHVDGQCTVSYVLVAQVQTGNSTAVSIRHPLKLSVVDRHPPQSLPHALTIEDHGGWFSAARGSVDIQASLPAVVHQAAPFDLPPFSVTLREFTAKGGDRSKFHLSLALTTTRVCIARGGFGHHKTHKIRVSAAHYSLSDADVDEKSVPGGLLARFSPKLSMLVDDAALIDADEAVLRQASAFVFTVSYGGREMGVASVPVRLAGTRV